MPEYTIAISNYNMGQTIGDSLQSILDQIDDRFEIVVVDDGSTDQSVDVLREKESEADALRVLELPKCRNRKLGVTRNISVQAADGDYVLLHLDVDDTFSEGITDIVEVFETLNENIPHNFYFMSCGFGIAKRDFLLRYGPYRNLPVGGEDQDMWRRLLADDSIIQVDSKNISKEVGYQKNNRALARRWLRVAVSNFQTGISYISYLQWSHENRTTLGFLYDLLLCAPIAYMLALMRESHDLPDEFQIKGRDDELLERETVSLAELESEYGFHINREELSTRAKQLYMINDSNINN